MMLEQDLQGQTVLILASVWPQAQASAASTRLLTLIAALQQAGAAVVCSADGRETTATAALRAQGVRCERLAPNDSRFDAVAAALQPAITVFDRFATEEKFGWRVRAACPDSLRVLDTIDLHCLRLARERALRASGSPEAPLHDHWPTLAPLVQDAACREVAAIYRCDLSLMISDAEVQLLTDYCGVPATLLHLCRFTYAPAPPALGFAERQHFAAIGHFAHAPNADAVVWMKERLWPLIKTRLPAAQVHIWGAGCTPKYLAMSSPELGFFVRGYAEDSATALRAARVNLAPLRFGAGIKGKIADGWWHGTPVVTTPIGAEGMYGDLGTRPPADADVAQLPAPAAVEQRPTRAAGEASSAPAAVEQRPTRAAGEASSAPAAVEQRPTRAGGEASSAPAAGEQRHAPGFGGLVASSAEDLAAAAVRLHEDQPLWEAAAAAASRLVPQLFAREATLLPLLKRLRWQLDQREAQRQLNFTGQMLWQQGLRSTEYFSRWIEAKRP